MDNLLKWLYENGSKDLQRYINLYRHNEISIRELVSKESGLWQFVCKNKLHREFAYGDINIFSLMITKQKSNINTSAEKKKIRACDYFYWIMVLSIQDEDKLEQFLLDNININAK